VEGKGWEGRGAGEKRGEERKFWRGVGGDGEGRGGEGKMGGGGGEMGRAGGFIYLVRIELPGRYPIKFTQALLHYMEYILKKKLALDPCYKK
jgi:hypothetical protein